MSSALISASYLSIMEARSADDFRDQIVRFAEELGFSYVSALTVVDHSPTRSDFISIDNMPGDFREAGASQADNQRRDPVMQHLKRGAVPLVWDQATYLRQGAVDLWEEQAAFGYRTGIALALHLPEGRHFMLGVDRDQTLPRDASALTRMVADLQLFAVHAQDTALRLFVPPEQLVETPSLTPRELESLRWTMEGKTAWELGSILGISERTAVLHIQNAMRKLGSVSKHQAVLKALRLGLIH
ncbi:LuxR family transcriptional regulator [Ideonella sp.]|uniref:LuxR family transcriptional regulator n=1 Tax=Ideonella sp. TaxID=1929293 RepID=UPI002B46B487|nr:LuxR family transcriptional regulator [Ideonella sp.]HJV72545.1 LuxR family transcriptional regulator [Ideonella sp.]